MWHLATIATRWVILRRRGSRATYRPVAQRVILPISVPLSYPIQFTPGNHSLYCLHATFRLTLCTNQRWAMAPGDVVSLLGLTHWLIAQRAVHREENHRESHISAKSQAGLSNTDCGGRDGSNTSVQSTDIAPLAVHILIPMPASVRCKQTVSS